MLTEVLFAGADQCTVVTPATDTRAVPRPKQQGEAPTTDLWCCPLVGTHSNGVATAEIYPALLVPAHPLSLFFCVCQLFLPSTYPLCWSTAPEVSPLTPSPSTLPLRYPNCLRIPSFALSSTSQSTPSAVMPKLYLSEAKICKDKLIQRCKLLAGRQRTEYTKRGRQNRESWCFCHGHLFGVSSHEGKYRPSKICIDRQKLFFTWIC